MTFNNLFFIFMFLPVLVLLYALLRQKTLRNILLVIASLLFYAWFNMAGLIVMLLCIVWNYLTGYELGHTTNPKERKRAFIIGIVFNVLILAIYKYLNMIIGTNRLSMPVGLSFFIFSCLSYLIDVYTNKSKAEYNILSLSLYICFLGKVTMGPIVQYHDMEEQIKNRDFNVACIKNGSYLFLEGLIKKAIFADSFSLLVTHLSGNTSVLGAWLSALAYMLEIYFDFSGYSDMAIGLSRCFGFDFAPNFEHPYTAISVQDFWRKWHISLSRWFRDYIYIPLGGSRVDNKKYIRNILIVWMLTGIWHGATFNFIVWGLYFGGLLLLEKFFLKNLLSKCPSFFQHMYALFLILISWIIFSSSNMVEAIAHIGRLFGIMSSSLADANSLFYLKGNLILILLGCILSTPIFGSFKDFIIGRFKNSGVIFMVALYLLGFIVSIAFIVQGTYQSFLYFAF